MNAVLNELLNFRLGELSEEWVQEIYDSEFLEFKDLPQNYEDLLESINIYQTFKSTKEEISNWLSSNLDKDENKSWTFLSQKFEYKKLLGLLGYYIDQGSKNVHIKEHRSMSLLAARTYYKLLSIPGFKAYGIYHSQLFSNSLTCLTYPKCMWEHEESYFNKKELIRDVNLVIDQMDRFVSDLKHIINILRLNPSEMNYEDILSNLINVSENAVVSKYNIDKEKFSNITQAVYKLVNVIICDLDRHPYPDAIQLLFKCLLAKLIAASVDGRHGNSAVGSSVVLYAASLLRQYGNAAVTAYTTLIQHLCYNGDGLERMEVRNARLSCVMKLMDVLPRKDHHTTVKWLLKLSATSRVAHRQIAIEILTKLLSHDADPTSQAAEVPSSDPEGGLCNRTDEPETTAVAETEVRAKSTEGVPEGDPEITQPLKNNAVSDEETVVDTGEASPHTVPHAHLLRVYYERAHDTSGTTRARALALLGDCVISSNPNIQNAVKELEGKGEVSQLVALTARCVCDERASVRRATALLAQRLLATRGRAPAARELEMLVSLCRDASIIVRTAAISVIGDLLEQWQTDELVDAFLRGPLHQLSDPETKVQDQVIGLVDQMLLDRLTVHSDSSPELPLPWMLLAGVVRQNMRRHLMQACNLLAKAKGISHRLVDVARSHLGLGGEERDLQCLVLLTSVARYVQCIHLDFLLDYYYKLEDDEKAYEGRDAALVLELLATWASSAALEPRRTLRQRLLRRLACATTDGCRPVCAALAVKLDPDDVEWATELMQISERRALQGGALEEWMRAADLSVVASCPPAPALVRLFQSALTKPPPDWTEERRGACVAGAARLAMRSRSAASVLTPPMAYLLKDAAAPLPARLNALLTIVDVATRYTCIVEPLLPVVCGCLVAGTVTELRRAAAKSITRLLVTGFLRLRTPLYYTYCALLADEDQGVREPAEYYVTCNLAADTIYHHFVDCIIHYNKVDSETLTFDGRQLIYDVMLQRLSLVQRLNMQCRLARDLLAHAAGLEIELPATLHAALLDAIALLCGPRMKVPKKPDRSEEIANVEELQERVTTNIVSHKMKQTVAEVLVPAVLQLYARVKNHGGQLVTYLVRIATDLLNDYRQEINELIESDKELVERVQEFQENIGLEPFGNTRNLVTTSAPPDPETPQAPRKRPSSSTPHQRKRRLKYVY